MPDEHISNIERYMKNRTTITVTDKLCDRLWSHRKKRKDSLSSVIERILNFFEENSIILIEDDENDNK